MYGTSPQEHEISGQQDRDPNGNTGIEVVGNADNHGGNNDGLVRHVRTCTVLRTLLLFVTPHHVLVKGGWL